MGFGKRGNEKSYRVLSAATSALLATFDFSYAGTYYVSPAGADSNSGTSSQPFKTIQKAADTISPGDDVIIRDGIYADPLMIKRGGSAALAVTFKAENIGRAFIVAPIARR